MDAHGGNQVDITNLAGLEKPITKLIETCAQGIGAIARPWLLKRDARALVAANRILEEGGLTPGELRLPSIEVQIQSRITHVEAQRQHNVYEVMDHAKAALPATVSEKPVHQDWTVRFFAAAQDVSEAETQLLWGKLLAGEVAAPGTFSLRSLETLRNLSSYEASKFDRFCEFDLGGALLSFEPRQIEFRASEKGSVIRIGTDEDDFAALYSSAGLFPHDVFLLRDAGLFSNEDQLRLQVKSPLVAPFFISLESGTSGVILERLKEPWTIDFYPIIRLTTVGQELARLCRRSPDKLQAKLASILENHGISCRLGHPIVDPVSGEIQELV